jgi:hypothetical protein
MPASVGDRGVIRQTFIHEDYVMHSSVPRWHPGKSASPRRSVERVDCLPVIS